MIVKTERFLMFFASPLLLVFLFGCKKEPEPISAQIPEVAEWALSRNFEKKMIGWNVDKNGVAFQSPELIVSRTLQSSRTLYIEGFSLPLSYSLHHPPTAEERAKFLGTNRHSILKWFNIDGAESLHIFTRDRENEVLVLVGEYKRTK